jgi:hypothetical protein
VCVVCVCVWCVCVCGVCVCVVCVCVCVGEGGGEAGGWRGGEGGGGWTAPEAEGWVGGAGCTWVWALTAPPPHTHTHAQCRHLHASLLPQRPGAPPARCGRPHARPQAVAQLAEWLGDVMDAASSPDAPLLGSTSAASPLEGGGVGGGVVWLASARDAAALHPAVRAAGRLDASLPLPAPGADGRAAMLGAALAARGLRSAPGPLRAAAARAEGYAAEDLRLLLDRAAHAAAARRLRGGPACGSPGPAWAAGGGHGGGGGGGGGGARSLGGVVELEEGDWEEALDELVPAAFWSTARAKAKGPQQVGGRGRGGALAPSASRLASLRVLPWRHPPTPPPPLHLHLQTYTRTLSSPRRRTTHPGGGLAGRGRPGRGAGRARRGTPAAHPAPRAGRVGAAAPAHRPPAVRAAGLRQDARRGGGGGGAVGRRERQAGGGAAGGVGWGRAPGRAGLGTRVFRVLGF